MTLQQNPYENSKKSILGQMASIQQQKTNIARQKISCPPDQRARLEMQEAEFFKQERSLEQKLSSVERMENQWVVNKQKADEVRQRQEAQRMNQQTRQAQGSQGQPTPEEKRILDDKARQARDDINKFYKKAA